MALELISLLNACEDLRGGLCINLGRGERSFVVAEALAARGVPALFLTGYAIKDAAIPSHLAHIPVLGKPVHDRVLADALARLDG